MILVRFFFIFFLIFFLLLFFSHRPIITAHHHKYVSSSMNTSDIRAVGRRSCDWSVLDEESLIGCGVALNFQKQKRE